VELGHKESFIESLERAIYRPFVAFFVLREICK